MAAFFPDKLQHSQSIEQFLKEIEDDFGSPGNSKFQDYIPKSRKNVQAMEEVSKPAGTAVACGSWYSRCLVCVCVLAEVNWLAGLWSDSVS